MQFGFRPGNRTTEAIFIVRQTQQKQGIKEKKLYRAFVDLKTLVTTLSKTVTHFDGNSYATKYYHF